MYLPIGWYGNSPYNPLGSMTRTRVVVNNKKLTQLDGFVSDNGQLDPLDVECERASVPAPYLVIAHFNYNPDNVDFTFYEPYSKYEIFIPFVGWVDINANKILNKELMIYYSLDVTTGQGSAYILSVTDSVLIWSGNCTIGVKIPLSTTNNLENLKQKQSNDLNMVIGLISSALSIGIGVVTENPVAIACGVLSAGKSIASNVQANKMLIEKMTTSFGSNESAFYSPQKVWIRRSYHKKLTNDLTTYKKTQGYPLNRYDDLQEYSGYVEIGDLHFDPMNENIYQDEISEIINLLHNGVVF